MPSKSIADVPARERAGEQRRQEGAHAGRAGEAGALADVDEEAHLAWRRAGTLRAHDIRPAEQVSSAGRRTEGS